MPKISVVIPTFNNGKLLKRAIDSVLNQTYQDFEVIVINDGSTDHTQELLESYGARITAVYQPNQERSAARNRGISLAVGQYIAFLDDDDWWLPEKLTKQIDFLSSYPKCEAICSYAYQITQENLISRIFGSDVPVVSQPFDALPWLYQGYSLPTLTVLLSRSLLDKTGLFDQGITYIEDWDLWLRSSIFTQMACYPEPLAYYQLHQRYMPAVFDRYRLQDQRLAVLSKIYQQVQENGCVYRLSEYIVKRGEARAWWYGALIDYAVDKIETAKLRAEESFERDPTFFIENSSGSANEMLAAFAVSLNEEYTKPDIADKFLIKVEQNLPKSIKPKIEKGDSRASLYAWYSHNAYLKTHYREAALFMQRAMFLKPSLVVNRGNAAVLAKGFLKSLITMHG